MIELPQSLAADFAAVLNAAGLIGSQQAGADTVITVDAANTITLQGVALANLTADDFHFI